MNVYHHMKQNFVNLDTKFKFYSFLFLNNYISLCICHLSPHPCGQIDILHLTQPIDLYTLKICAYLLQYLLVIHREKLWNMCLHSIKSALKINSGEAREKCPGLQCNSQYLFPHCCYPVSQLLVESTVSGHSTFSFSIGLYT